MSEEQQGPYARQQDHEHDWQRVNSDGNRDIYKCAACGALQRE